MCLEEIFHILTVVTRGGGLNARKRCVLLNVPFYCGGGGNEFMFWRLCHTTRDSGPFETWLCWKTATSSVAAVISNTLFVTSSPPPICWGRVKRKKKTHNSLIFRVIKFDFFYCALKRVYIGSLFIFLYRKLVLFILQCIKLAHIFYLFYAVK